MQKVTFFKSIHVKIVLIYILLILLAMQIIGLYFVQQLEEKLIYNFEESILDRMEIIEFSVKEEITRTRTDDDLKVEQSLRSVLQGFNSSDISEIRVVDARYRILGSSAIEKQPLIGQRSAEELVRETIVNVKPQYQIKINEENDRRVWVATQPIVTAGGELLGSLYLEAKVENVYDRWMRSIQSLQEGRRCPS